MVLEIICVEPLHPQYSGVLETCLALRYWFFEVLSSESVNMVSVTSASRYITLASCYPPRYQSRSSMYIHGLIYTEFGIGRGSSDWYMCVSCGASGDSLLRCVKSLHRSPMRSVVLSKKIVTCTIEGTRLLNYYCFRVINIPNLG